MDGLSAHDVLTASEGTRDRGAARVEGFSVLGSPVPQEADSRGSGVVDFRFGRSRVTVRLITDHMRDSSRERDSRVVRKLKDVFAQTAETIFDGGRMYTAAGDGTWTAHGEISDPRSQLDPLWVFDLLAGVSEEVTPIDEQDVRGVPTVRYELTTDLERACEHRPLQVGGLDEPQRWWKPRSPNEDEWRRGVPMQVWLDETRLIRRVAAAPLKPGPSDQPLWAVTELWDFGLPVEVDLPDIAGPTRS